MAISLKDRETDRLAREVAALTSTSETLTDTIRKALSERLERERLLQQGAFEVVSVTPQQTEIAIDAFRRFGKCRHPAGLNTGDCFSYALAMSTGDPLLFKGDDFIHTDVRSALPTGMN
jgi:ribonuclease VapC